MFKFGKEKIAIFGGSFDPPHKGHQAIVDEALRGLDIDKLMVVPTFLNPFKTRSFATPQQRLKWTKEIFKSCPKIIVDDYEIREGKATTTAQTLRHFQNEYEVKYIIIGADNLASIDKWYNFDALNEEVTWVVATRTGYGVHTSMLKHFILLEVKEDVSSTQIRTAVDIKHIDDIIKDDVLKLLENKG